MLSSAIETHGSSYSYTATLTHNVLDVARITQMVQSDQAGAIAIFVGTTRDNFKGRAQSVDFGVMDWGSLINLGEIL